MVKPVLQNHPIAMKTRNFHENRENRRVFGVYEKTWIFHENLPNPWIRENFADGDYIERAEIRPAPLQLSKEEVGTHPPKIQPHGSPRGEQFSFGWVCAHLLPSAML